MVYQNSALKRGTLGSVRNCKTTEKIIQNHKTGRRIRSKLKTPCKTDKFSHLCFKILIYPIQSLTRGVYRGFTAIQDQWRCIIATQIDKKPEPKKEKLKTTSDTKSKNPLVIFTKTNNQRLKKTENP